MSDAPESPIDGIALRSVVANGIRQRYAECGTGPLVLLCHGWPESWYSWRHTMRALGAAGWRCVAPDMRGYGGTDAPEAIERYTILDLVGDMVGLLRELGAAEAVVVGHDWGAPVAWHCALLRPDLFRAVAGLSVPWAPRGGIDLLGALDRLGVTRFYMQYFQTPGVAEAELEADVRASLRRIYFSASGDGAGQGRGFAQLPEGGGLLTGVTDPAALPAWLTEADLDWYLTRNWHLMAPWHGQPIHQPSLFIAGSRDGVLKFPASMQQIEAFSRTLPGLRGCHIVDGAGHWVQQERPDEVSALLLAFLEGLAA
jgi:pimeloyl-ACP methyl ester carboxylesterase